MKNVIITPTYKEKENIQILVPLIFSILPEVYVVVADDNSPDGTGSVVTELQKQYPHLSLITRLEKNGLGRAYTNAFSQVLKDTDVDVIVMMDADLSLQPKHLPEMLKKIKQYSVVIGSKYAHGSEILGYTLPRKILSLCGNFYCRMILPMPIRDFTCGFIAIRASLLRKIDFSKMESSASAFIIELKYLLYKAGGTFVEIPIQFVERVNGESKFSSNIIKDGIIAPWRIISKNS